MTLSSKISLLFGAALLVAQTTFAACPDWEANTSYSAGEKIAYQGLNYEAARDVAPNTPPNPADNGWFWVETTEECDNTIKIQADEVEILTPHFPGVAWLDFNIDREGIDMTRSFPTGGGEGTEIGYSTIKLDVGVTGGGNTTELAPGKVIVTRRTMGDTDTTKITAEEITTETVNATEFSSKGNDPRVFGKLNKETLTLQTASTNLSLSPNGGLDIMSSFGSTKVDDHGIVTTQSITGTIVNADNIYVSGINLTQYILQLEARIAELEAK